MTKIDQYCEKLNELKIPKDALQEAALIMQDVPEILPNLSSPAFSLERKNIIVDRVFPKDVRTFLKVLCENGDISNFLEIVDTFTGAEKVNKEPLEATLLFVKEPTKDQLERIKQFLVKKYNRNDIVIEMEEDATLGSGFVIRANNEEFDWSSRGRLDQLQDKLVEAGKEMDAQETVSTQGIISILKSEISDFSLEAQNKEIGVVKWVGDGIANIDGIDHAEYGEIVMFDCGVKGMVQAIRRNEVGCILFGSEQEIKEGSRVMRTGKRAGVSVGDDFKGRVVDALGAPIDGKGAIHADDYRPIENPAPGIVDRKSVTVPMETGILSIDSMFPIGRGQRELIIGDRQTGKTSIATDTIINQRGKDVVCVYVAIGQKASTVAKLVNTLERENAMEYTVIVSATASDPASLQYIAPYSATSIAEHFMYQGKDVLIVYDDLSKHAVAYRAISLLLERPPGREAYPGDVFYLHSRLLERSSRLNEEAGGGSITALPIIETQAGDVSAYIPTNVISITDGQIFLESDLFFAGMRPAVNVGLSVSRVGGAAQTKAMKKASGSIRIDLAQYREMEVFTQFSSDLDDATKAQLAYGAALMELLKQPLCHPLSLAEQVITLVAATDKIFVGLETAEIKPFQGKMLSYFKEQHSDIVDHINMMKELPDDLRKQIVEAAQSFKDNVSK